MARINILDEGTINKIAAGEVVERPASIIKELVENSIDAKSTSITVEIENGGKDLIKIVDNGCGIDSDDINKAFLRHATSKISKLEDLYELVSLGFRGEALASIASVSKLEMITKTKDALMGVDVVLEGGKIISKDPVASNNGTQIYVRDLFYNTPARKKFLKSNQSEQIAITQLMNKLAIGNPNLKIKYINNNKVVFETLGDGNLLNLIRLIYGSDVSTNLINISYKSKYFEIEGYIGNNNVYRSNKNLQHIFINGRYVKSSRLMEVVNESYKAIIPINKFPVYIINMKLDPSTIDVNIHPNKLEVKFDKEKEILSELLDYIRGVLLQNSLIGRYKPSTYSPSKSSATYHDFMFLEDKNKIIDKKMIKEMADVKEDNTCLSDEKKFTDDLFKNNEGEDSVKVEREKTEEVVIGSEFNFENATNKFLSLDEQRERLIENSKTSKDDGVDKKIGTQANNVSSMDFTSEVKTTMSDDNSKDFTSEYNSSPKEGKNNIDDAGLDIDRYMSNDKNTSFADSPTSINEEVSQLELEIYDKRYNKDFIDLKFLGILFDTYILFSKNDKFILMDQHAAHERVRFEMYMTKFRTNDISMQFLLEPIVIDLSYTDMEIVRDNLDRFERFGFIIEEYGHRSISIRAVPNSFGMPESQKFIYEIIDNIDSLDSIYDTKYDEIAEIACKSSIKANDKINYMEVEALVDKLKLCENPYTCPHGRPIMVSMTKYDVEKMFKRKGL